MSQPSVVVTGAGGFVGQALVRHLAAQGWAVRALARHNTPALHDGPAWARTVEGAQAVVHLAAKAHQLAAHTRQDDSRFDDNLALTNAVLDACVQTAVPRLLFVSSIGVNGVKTTGQPFSEDDAPAPTEAYARSKWHCEQRIRQVSAQTGLQHLIVRPPLVYGPQAPGNFGRLVAAVRRGWPLPLGAVHNRRNFIGLDNLVDALALALRHPAALQHTFVLADAETVSTSEFLRLTAQALGRSPRLWPLPEPILRALARGLGQSHAVARLCDSLEVDSRAFRAQLGWVQPWSLAQGLARAAHLPRG